MTPDLLVRVPAFTRLDDYLGVWSVEADRFAGLWRMAGAIDFSGHDAATLAKAGRRLPRPESGPQAEDAALDLLAWMAGADMGAAAEKAPAAGGKSVAVIKLTGLLMKSQSSMGGTSTIQARRDIRQAVADPDVSGILLAIDSPGGTVAGTDDLAADVRAARRQKPVWAHVEDLGASAAYWVASQAERVTANSPTALVGSIGTIQVVRDYSAAAEREGVRTLVFATGGLKGLGTPGTKVTDEQAAHVQGLVDRTQQHFDAAVQKGRGLSATELAAVRHGGVMTATEAKDKRLIDAVQPLSRTLAEFSRQTKPGSGPAAGSLPMLKLCVLPTLGAREK